MIHSNELIFLEQIFFKIIWSIEYEKIEIYFTSYKTPPILLVHLS